MATQVMTLQEYADQLQQLAADWEGGSPAVLIGDVHDDVTVSEKDGYTQHGIVGYADEVFDGNGVSELSLQADHRFYGTMLINADGLGNEAQENLSSDGGEA